MADWIPEIVKRAHIHPEVRVACRRPKRMAVELRKHLPDHDVVSDEARGIVVIKSRLVHDRSCGSGPACKAQ